VAEYHRAAEEGIFRPEERLELLDGLIYRKMSPQLTPHAFAVMMLSKRMHHLPEEEYTVRTQLPIILDDYTEPESDVCVVRGAGSSYAKRQPGPRDVALAAEVASSSLDKDLKIKHRIYASAGIPEYWVVDTTNRQVLVMSDPAGKAYAQTSVVGEGMAVTFGSVSIAVTDLFAPKD
jgi:Uma2 family endonuclease